MHIHEDEIVVRRGDRRDCRITVLGGIDDQAEIRQQIDSNFPVDGLIIDNQQAFATMRQPRIATLRSLLCAGWQR